MSTDSDLKILVVDDSGTMRLMFKQMLKKSGFEKVFVAIDGKDAIEKLKSTQVDLIISDWNMPNIDGLELLKRLRATESYRNIPFIMATAQGDKTQEALVKDTGGNNHIAKPFTEEQLKEVIEETLGLREKKQVARRVPQVKDGKVELKIAHIQITDHLVLGVLKHQIETGVVTPRHFTLETVCMPGWNPVQKALETGEVDGAFVLAPIAMDLFAFDVPIRLVMLAHKNGSIFVRNKTYNTDLHGSIKDFYKYKVVDIPHKMSIHNMLAHKYLSEMGLLPGVPGKKAINVRFEVVPPIQMPEIMKENYDIGGFIVAEPIGSSAIAKGIADLEFYSASLWDNHPCCVAAMQESFIEQHTDAVFELSSLLVAAGEFIENNKSAAAEIAVAFLDPQKKVGLKTPVLENVLNMPQGIKMNDLYPVVEDLDIIQRYMFEKMGIGKLIDVEKFVDLRFADAVCQGR